MTSESFIPTIAERVTANAAVLLNGEVNSQRSDINV